MTYNPYEYTDRDDDDILHDVLDLGEDEQQAVYPSPAERVQAGVLWLNEVEPDWLNRIDLETLNILGGTTCIAGQLGGDYFEFFDLHGMTTTDTRRPFAKLHGFLGLDGREGNADFHDERELTDAWKQAITALRG